MLPLISSSFSLYCTYFCRSTLQSFKQTLNSFTALREEGEAPPRYTASATAPPRPQEPPRPQQRQQVPAATPAVNSGGERLHEEEGEREGEEEGKKSQEVSTKIAKGIIVGRY